MAQEDGVTVSFTEVRERFEESANTLASAKEKLEALSAEAAGREEIRNSLKESSDEVKGFTQAAREAVETLSKAQADAAGAFESMKEVADGTDIKAIREGVVDIQKKLDRISSLEAELKEVRDKYERLVAVAGARTLKKAGLAP